ncbi:MAG: MerR family transcriptional regulator [Christensenellales bacterium]
MRYTAGQLAKLAGVSKRTLHYYDEIGLLRPQRNTQSGYRLYGRPEVDRLQQILFYRHLGLPLDEIKAILSDPSFDAGQALLRHMSALEARRAQLDGLIETLRKTIAYEKGEIDMRDDEKFEGFKDRMIAENEEKFGKEARSLYGDDAVDAAGARIKGATKEQMAAVEELSRQFNETLKAAARSGDPAGELAQKACDLHHRWLTFFWGGYSKEAHRNIGQMYVDDERFAAYYNDIVPGGAVFLRDALAIYCK